MGKKKLNRKKLNPNIPVFTGAKYSDKVSVQLFTYNTENFREDVILSDDKFNGFANDESQYWLNTHGIHDVMKITNTCEKSNVHSLTIQDILDVTKDLNFKILNIIGFFL